jgi:hypothetical protein
MTKKIAGGGFTRPGERPPNPVRLPGFVTEEEIGRGDLIRGAASYFGVQPCGGCDQRRVALNHWLTFGNGRRR